MRRLAQAGEGAALSIQTGPLPKLARRLRAAAGRAAGKMQFNPTRPAARVCRLALPLPGALAECVAAGEFHDPAAAGQVTPSSGRGLPSPIAWAVRPLTTTPTVPMVWVSLSRSRRPPFTVRLRCSNTTYFDLLQIVLAPAWRLRRAHARAEQSVGGLNTGGWIPSAAVRARARRPSRACRNAALAGRGACAARRCWPAAGSGPRG